MALQDEYLKDISRDKLEFRTVLWNIILSSDVKNYGLLENI